MTHVRPEECLLVLVKMDSFLSDELPPLESLPIGSHLDTCPDCGREIAIRRHLRCRLKTAVGGLEAPPFLGARIRTALQLPPTAVPFARKLAPLAAGILILLGGTIAYQLGHLRLTAESQEAYIASVSSRVGAIMRIGLRDHLECAIFRNYPAKAPALEELVKSVGSQYQDLLPVVKDQVPQSFQLMMAHRCRSHGHRFLHFAFRDGSRILSLVLTTKDAGQSFTAGNLLPELQQSGIPIYHAGVQSVQIDAFETPHHLVYLISDLSRQQNLELLRVMAPALHRILGAIEA